MGNNCTTEVLVINSVENKREPFDEGCLAGCVSQKPLMNPEVDEAEFQTHDRSQVPKGKISINSIAYLKKEEISFLKACAGKNVSAIRYLIKKGVNVNLLDEDRTSPLHVACRSGGLQVVEELINNGANLDMADIAGWTPLHIAANYQRALICHILLKKGANPYHLSRVGETPWDLVKEKNTEEIFFIHFDRVELRKMSKNKTEIPPGEAMDEQGRLTDLKPRENVHRSFVDLEFKKSLREGDSLTMSTKRLNTKNEDKMKSTKTPSEHSFNAGRATKGSIEHKFTFADEPIPIKKSSSAQKEKKSSVVSDQPKKHKYYNYFKKMKIVHMKNLKEANDALYTLQSEEDSEEENYDLKVHTIEQFDTSQIKTEEIASEPNILERKPSRQKYRSTLDVRKNSIKNPSLNGSFATSTSGFTTNQKLDDKFNTTSRSFLLLHNTFGINQLIQKDAREIDILTFDSNLVKDTDRDFLTLPELNQFKIDARFNENIHKMGIELFNLDAIKGISFLMLFRLLKKSPKDISHFLYKNEPNLNYKKNIIEVTNFLTNLKFKESRDLVEAYGSFFNYTNLSFFEALKNYFGDFAIDNDPEKIDWLLRGFSGQYFKKLKQRAKQLTEFSKLEFETAESVRMFAFVTIMLNIESQYEDNPLGNTLEAVENMRRDFLLNISGLNDGENFNKNLVNEVFEKARSSKLIKFIGKDYFHEKTKKVAFRSAKLSIKVQRQSKKDKKIFKEYYLYFNGPVCFVVKVLNNSSVPKGLFLINQIGLKSHKNQTIVFGPIAPSVLPIPWASFKGHGIILGSKAEISYMLLGTDDFKKIETYCNSL